MFNLKVFHLSLIDLFDTVWGWDKQNINRILIAKNVYSWKVHLSRSRLKRYKDVNCKNVFLKFFLTSSVKAKAVEVVRVSLKIIKTRRYFFFGSSEIINTG